MIHWTAYDPNGRPVQASSDGVTKRQLRRELTEQGYTDIVWTDRRGVPVPKRQPRPKGLGSLLGSFFRAANGGRR